MSNETQTTLAPAKPVLKKDARWLYKKNPKRAVIIDHLEGEEPKRIIFAKNPNTDIVVQIDEADFVEKYKPAATAAPAVSAKKLAKSNGNGHAREDVSLTREAGEAPIAVSFKGKEGRFSCPCRDTHIESETTTLDELVERLLAFKRRHAACLSKNQLPFGGVVAAGAEEATQ